MTQYINKSALVAEIEKRISRNKKRKEWEDIPEKRHQLIIEGQLLGELKHFLDSLEVKEVDLDYIKDELDRVVKIYKPDGDFGWGTLYNVATHFFELGLKAQKGEEV